jgi:phosphoenolpyruvate carboxykinase (GTP)
MSIQDFVAIPLGKYVRNNLDFAKKLANCPLVFGVNYFLRDEQGAFVNGVRDKHVWIKWMELRVHGDARAAETPTGMIPLYADLKRLFKETLGKEYSHEDYVNQFSIRVPENLAKILRVTEFHRTQSENTPAVLFEILQQQQLRLEQARAKFGDRISPECFGV